MANSIKESGEGAALQITKEARSAGLAEETDEDDVEGAARWARLADVRVYGFDGALLVVDPDRMDDEHIAALVATIARDTGSIHLASNASIRPAGNGCMVSLPGLHETDFEIGDRAPAYVAQDMLLITEDSRDGVRLAEDIKAIREDQIA